MQFQENANDFFNNYECERVVVCPKDKIKNLKPRKLRTCRFCGLGSSQTTFKEDAHILSSLLGNKYLISDFECDICNHTFDVYETSLASFLGIKRTLLRVQNNNQKKKGVPTFTSSDKIVKAHEEDFHGSKCITVERPDISNAAFELDLDTSVIRVNTFTQPFIPLYVYKAFFKMGLSCISDVEAKNYKLAFEYITSKENNGLNGCCFIKGYEMNFIPVFNSPSAVLFKKKLSESKIPSHYFVLFFQNVMFQLPLPLNENDLNFYGQEIEMFSCPPPFLGGCKVEEMQFHPFNFPLSSMEKTRINDGFDIKLDKNGFANAVGIDQEFDFNEIVKIQLTDPDFSIPAEHGTPGRQ